MRHLKSFLTVLTISIGLGLSFSAQAQISILNGPSPIEFGATLNSAPFTVSAGSSVLVVTYGSRNQGNANNPGNPTNFKWNGIPMTLAVSANTTASTYDYNVIYYLINPPPGSGSVTAILGTGVTQTWWEAYTLTNVSTNSPLLTGTTFSTSAATINNTIANVATGDWAAVNMSGSANNSTVTLTAPNGGTVLTTTDKADGNATMTMGSVSNCPAGNNQFVLTDNMTGQKLALCEAIFTPFAPAPAAPVLTVTSGSPGSPAQADLSWTVPTNTATFILERGQSVGVFTDFTNILGANITNFVDSNVVSGTTYYYTIAAANITGTNFSTTNSATPSGPPFPPILGAGAFGAGKVSLHWTPRFGATNYVVQRSTTSGAETFLTNTTNTTYLDSGLSVGTTYYYTVDAVSTGGTSPISDEANALVLGSDWFLFDNFSIDTVNAPLNGQTGSAGLGAGWTNLGGGTPITVENSSTFGGANYSQYTPGSPANIGDYESGLGIPGNSTAATVFLEFSLPGIQPTEGNVSGTNAVAMNFDIDNSNPPGALTGSSATGPSAQFNYDNTTGDGFFRVNSGGTFYYATISPSNTPYLPTPSNVYYFWFVINAAKGTYQIYLANGSETGTNVDAGGLGAAPTLMWGNTSSNGTGQVITYSFRNVASGGTVGQPVNVIGTGPGSSLGTVPQIEFANIFVDPSSQNLTNPVTGGAAVGTPQIFTQPQQVEVFAGATAIFNIVGSAGVNYQWQSNGVPVVDGGRISGSMTDTLTISNVTAADAAQYSCIVNNPATSAFASSTAAALTVVTPNGAFETALVADMPSHFYAFEDTGSPSSGTEPAYDFAGGDNGTYGANTQNGVAGPRPTPDGFPGFSATNSAAQYSAFAEPSHVTINSPWNLNTNTVTLTAWIFPTSPQDNSTGIIFNRGAGSDVEGLNITTNSRSTLGYTWNNDPATLGWDSGLQPPVNQWSFVALVVTPTNATIDMMNTNGEYSSTFDFDNVPAPFAGTTMIGDDSGTTTGARTFIGAIDEVGVFGTALTQAQLQAIFTNASGVTQYPATNIVSVATPTLYPGQSAQLSAVVGGSVPLTLTWQIDGTNLTDGPSVIGVISGSSTGNLVISNLTVADEGQTFNVTLVTSNSLGAFTNDPPVTFSVSTPGAPQNITTTGQEAQGLDWNTGSSWSDGNPVSVSVFSEPGSTYLIVPGTEERSPATTNAVFPGNELVIEGNGVLQDGSAAAFATQTTTGELRLKASGATTFTNFGTVYTDGGTITFPDLQLDGGQIDNGNSSIVALNGEIDVITNSAIYADASAAASIRSVILNAYLTGTGTLTYSFLGTSTVYTNNALVVSCPTNTFSGQWNIGAGALVGNAPNSLGTNSINIGVNGALETTYNLVTTNGSLLLNGQMYLYTTDTFYGLGINGSNVPPGTYSFAQLNAAFPQNFPVTWPVQLGSATGTNTGVGSITVLASLPPTFTQQPVSLSLYPGQTAVFTAAVQFATNFQWWFTNQSNVGTPLADGGNISGSQTTSLTVSNVADANAGTYALIATGPGSSTSSAGAVLTILPPGSATTISTTEFEPAGSDWNTPASWNDALAASVSVFANPGSTYEIAPGTLERSPISTNAVFPGIVLAIEGNGVLFDGNNAGFTNQAGTGELRLKESGVAGGTNFGTVYTLGGSVTFPDLQLNGGQVDNGSASEVDLNGQIDVLADSAIYADSAAAGSIRSMRINAFLTGTGTLTYTYLSTNSTNNDLIISCPTNTFSGQWNILQGALLGNAPNALGTNSLTIETNAALETTYNLDDPAATLTLNGQMYLYTADTFLAVSINGAGVPPGTYSFAQLNSVFPLNFPVTWPVQLGSSTGTNTGVGSITVLTGPPLPQAATITTFTFANGTLTLSGTHGSASGSYHLVTTSNLAPPVTWTVLASGSFDSSGNFSVSVPVSTDGNEQFFSIKSP